MTSTWDAIVGQQVAVNKLQLASINPVHAYLLIGPDGCGKDEAARAFAASLLSTSHDMSDRTSGLVMRGSHPDVHEIRRTGASLLVKDAEEAIRLSLTTAMESKRKIIVLHEINLMQDTGVVRLLKTIEEPADGVFFILLADAMTPLLVTIASRCVVVNFVTLDDDTVIAALQGEGVSSTRQRLQQKVRTAASRVPDCLLVMTHLFSAVTVLPQFQIALTALALLLLQLSKKSLNSSPLLLNRWHDYTKQKLRNTKRRWLCSE